MGQSECDYNAPLLSQLRNPGRRFDAGTMYPLLVQPLAVRAWDDWGCVAEPAYDLVQVQKRPSRAAPFSTSQLTDGIKRIRSILNCGAIYLEVQTI